MTVSLIFLPFVFVEEPLRLRRRSLPRQAPTQQIPLPAEAFSPHRMALLGGSFSLTPTRIMLSRFLPFHRLGGGVVEKVSPFPLVMDDALRFFLSVSPRFSSLFF